MRKTKKKQLFAALLSSALIVSNIAAAFPQTTVFASEGGEAVNGETTAEVAEEPAPSAVQETPAAEPAAEPVEVQDPAPAEISVPEGTSSDNAAEAASGTTGTEAEGTGESTVPEVSSEAAAAVSSEAAVLTEETAPSLTILYKAGEGGSVTVGQESFSAAYLTNGAVPAGAEAVSAEGFQFVNWTAADESIVSEGAVFVPSVTADMSGEVVYTANFAPVETPVTIQRMVTVEYIAGEGGKVSRSSETIDVGADGVSFEGAEAAADDGYRFVGWTDANGQAVSSEARLVPAVSADLADKTVYTANFEKKKASMPEQDFEGTAGGVHVSVHADEGNFPEGTTMKLKTVPTSSILNNDSVQNAVGKDREVVDAAAVDITFQDKDGNEIEPVGTISVNMRAGSRVEGESHKILHIDDNGKASTVTSASATGASFDAGEFSIYVITGIDPAEQKPAIATYVFYDAEGKEITGSTQKVKNGETVYAPTTPEKSGSRFLGWSYTKGADALLENDPGDFGTLTNVSVTTTGRVELYPVFKQVYYVFFLDSQGRVSTTKEGAKGDTIQVSDVVIPLDSAHSVTGWYTDEALKNKVDSVTLADDNVTLYPKVEKGHYLYFVSGEGARYVKPAFVAAEKGTAAPDDPTRPGYTFLHWSEREEGSAYTFGSSISEDTTLYAVWEAKTDTTYTVIFWKQSVLDKKNAADNAKTYDYAESVSRTGTTGVSVSPKWSDQNKGYTGFTYNSAKSMSVTINGDGTTILNVYYDRNLLTINFNRYVDGHWEYVGGFWGGRKWIEGHWDSEAYTGLYGQTLAQNGYDKWPDDYHWYNQSWNNQLTFLDAFIFDTLREYGDEKNIYLYGRKPKGVLTVNHYKQNLDGSYSYQSPTNSTATNGGTFFFSNKYTGFTVDSYEISNKIPKIRDSWTPASPDGFTKYSNNLHIRYTRNRYNLAYYNHNGVARETTLLYEASLGDYESYVPSRPSGLPEAYTFQGWFKDKECTVPFDFNSTMPANDVMIYAKWAAPSCTGTIHTNIKGTGRTIEIQVDYGGMINENDMPSVQDAEGNPIQEGTGNATVQVPEGYSWVGWATKDGEDFTLYNFNTNLYSDITLYPYYLNTEKFKVTYDVGKGSGTAPIDSREYAENSCADVKPASGITPPDGKTFLYWTANEAKYYPGDKVKISGNLTLTAVYGNTAGPAFLIYHSNYPNGTDSTTKPESYENNTAITLAEAGFTAPDGYYFAGWNTSKNGSGDSYAAGTVVSVDNTSENHLFAVWEVQKEITLKAMSAEALYDGTVHSAAGVETDTFTFEGVEYKVSGFTTEDPSAKDAGVYTNRITGRFVVRKGNTDVTRQFVIHTEDGALTIRQRSVILTSASASKVYDGSALTRPDVTVGGDGFVDGEVSDIKATGSILTTGSVPNPITYKKLAGYKDENYSIETDEGTLTITQNENEIVVNARNAVRKYDGRPLTEDEADVTGLPEGYTADVTVSGSITDVGTADNVVETVAIKDASGNDVTDQFKTITKNNGTLTVTRRSVTLTSETVTREYNGTALTAPNVTVTGDGFVSGEVTDLKATGTITKVGSTANPIAYTEGTGFKADNYEITRTEGTLTITRNDAAIKVSAGSDSKMYDGNALTKNTYSITGLPQGFTAEVTVSGSITDVGSAENEVTSVVIRKGDEDVTDQFSGVTKENGTLTVTKRSVKLVSESASKKYDGTPLTAPDVKVEGDGFVDGEVSDIRATGSIKTEGSVPNTITYKTGDGFKADNYKIEIDEGTLTITKNDDEIIVNARNASKMYDGMPLTEAGADVTGLPEGFTAAVKTSGSITNAGTADNVIDSVVISNEDGEEVTGQFSKIKKNNGELTVNQRSVILTSKTAQKEYDGTPLTASEVTVSGDGFVEGEVSDLMATGSITDVGSTANTITYSKADTFIESNYSIEQKEGTLKITPNTGAILVTADSAEKTYDGTLLTADSFTAEGLPEGFTAEAEVRGAILDAGTAENVVENIVIRDKEGRDATRNFDNIAKKNGLLTVNKRNVTFTSASASKEYDGSALTAKEVTISGDGFIDGEGVTFNVTGSRTEVGTSLNTFEYTLNGSPNKVRAGRETGLLELLFSKMIVRAAEQITKEENYSIQVVYGTLTVTAKSENSETSTTTNTPPTTNEPSAQISVGVQKVWVDNNNAEGLRPDSITVQLYRNGDAYGSPVTLSAGNGWAYTWSGLEAGASYGVVETSVPAGYTSSLGGDQNSGYVLTNTLMPTISGNYGDGDAAAATGALPTIGGAIRTGDESNLELWLLTFVMAAAAVIAAIVKKRKKGAEK